MDSYEKEELIRELREEGAIMDVLSSRMASVGFYSAEDAENLAYRMAEILVTSKNLYTQIMPRIIDILPDQKDEMLEFLTEVRMNFQYIRDCIEEFEDDFFSLMKDEQDEQILDEDDEEF